jgi:hypothetical protein
MHATYQYIHICWYVYQMEHIYAPNNPLLLLLAVGWHCIRHPMHCNHFLIYRVLSI